MVCYNDFAVNVMEGLSVFYYKMRGFADIKISKKNSECMRNIGTGYNAKIFFPESENSDKWEYKNGKNNSTNSKTEHGNNFGNAKINISENIFDFRLFAFITHFLSAHNPYPNIILL